MFVDKKILEREVRNLLHKYRTQCDTPYLTQQIVELIEKDIGVPHAETRAEEMRASF